MLRATRGLFVGLAVLIAGAPTLGDPPRRLEIVTEYGSWPASVATLQYHLGAQGTTLHVGVVDALAHRPARCGEYALSLDDVAERAFSLAGCDPATGATAVTLVDRRALFDHS